jgi:predicted ribosomally synthesized peptide with SipW-like signal peptide
LAFEGKKGEKVKNVFLSIVIVCALAVAGIGGTLAGFSDTETIDQNKIEMGSIDLKVNGTDDLYWGTGNSGVIWLENLNPAEAFYTEVTVQNAGSKDGYLYFKLKKLNCYNIEDEHAEWWYEEPNAPFGLKPEPELIAEYGGPDDLHPLGKVDSVWVEGLGVEGDNCSMSSNVYMAIDFDGDYVIGEPFAMGEPITGVQMGTLDDGVHFLGVLPLSAGEHTVSFWLMVPQVRDLLWESRNVEASEPDELAYWPTNRLMADGITFEIEFLLFDNPLP